MRTQGGSGNERGIPWDADEQPIQKPKENDVRSVREFPPARVPRGGAVAHDEDDDAGGPPTVRSR